MAAFTWWNVYLNGRCIDSIPYVNSYQTAEDVRRSLINHDGYDERIIVRKARK